MEGFNNKLEVGMQALVIGCSKPENLYVIGSVVTVEAILPKGSEMPKQFMSQLARDLIESGKNTWPPLEKDRIVVSGVHTSDLIELNHATFEPKYLMPIPPLKELEREKELSYDH